MRSFKFTRLWLKWGFFLWLTAFNMSIAQAIPSPSQNSGIVVSAPACVSKSVKYYLITGVGASSSAGSGNRMAFVVAGGPPGLQAALCPGNYYVHVHLSLYADQGGGSSGCGGYYCGVIFNHVSDQNGTVLIFATNISDRDYNYEPKIVDFWTSSNSYNPANGGLNISISAGDTIYPYQGITSFRGAYNPDANYVSMCRVKSNCQ